jgi:LPS O-antigen subunit length determinant protein (WzzB/FepE family)
MKKIIACSSVVGALLASGLLALAEPHWHVRATITFPPVTLAVEIVEMPDSQLFQDAQGSLVAGEIDAKASF